MFINGVYFPPAFYRCNVCSWKGYADGICLMCEARNMSLMSDDDVVLLRMEWLKHIHDGESIAEVSKAFKVSGATLRRWVKRFEEMGEEGLRYSSSKSYFTFDEKYKGVLLTRTELSVLQYLKVKSFDDLNGFPRIRVLDAFHKKKDAEKFIKKLEQVGIAFLYEQVFDSTITSLGFHKRILYALYCEKAFTIEELKKKKISVLVKDKFGDNRLGKKSVAELKEKLSSIGVYLDE